jgi:sortase (surface protein transpeptidase)
MVRMKIFIRPSAAFFIAFLAVVAFNPGPALAATITSSRVSAVSQSSSGTPVYLYIPSIKLLSNVQGVGIDQKGNMDVPSGKTNNVGWYERGVAPGGLGTAVLDAHNTAAFKALNKVPVGADVYVYMSDGTWLKFKVNKAKTYSMETLEPSTLFEPANTSAQKLNLITCAGLSLGGGEATHRLIVSATMV